MELFKIVSCISVHFKKPHKNPINLNPGILGDHSIDLLLRIYLPGKT